MAMLVLSNPPDLGEAIFWDVPRPEDTDLEYILWPAVDEGRPVMVRISASELAAFDGDDGPLNAKDLQSALKRCQDAIEKSAGHKIETDEAVVTISPGDLIRLRSPKL
jgi:hypothetical protein